MGALKRLGDLTVPDLRSSPVWRYEGGTGPEALVEPARRDSLSQADDEIFLAATEFVLFDASRHFGFCFPADDSGLDYLQPSIVSDSGHVNFWFDEPAPPELLSRQWRALGKTPHAVFPVDFQCLVPVDGRTVRGRIEGIESPQVWPPEFPPPETVSEASGGSPDAATPASPEGAERALTARPIDTKRKDPAKIGKRTSRRRKTELPVQFSQGPLQGTGVIGDISPRGVFVRSVQIPSGAGPLLRLTVNLPGGRKLVLKGRVVRRASSSPAAGFGLKLEEEWPDYERLFPGGPPDNK